MSNACIPPNSLYNCPPNPLVTIISLLQFKAGADPGGGDRLPKTYESNFIHHDFVQFRKKHSRYKAILPSIVLSQQCCEICFISLTVVKPRMRLDYHILLKSHLLNLLTGSDPGSRPHNKWIRVCFFVFSCSTAVFFCYASLFWSTHSGNFQIKHEVQQHVQFGAKQENKINPRVHSNKHSRDLLLCCFQKYC